MTLGDKSKATLALIGVFIFSLIGTGFALAVTVGGAYLGWYLIGAETKHGGHIIGYVLADALILNCVVYFFRLIPKSLKINYCITRDIFKTLLDK